MAPNAQARFNFGVANVIEPAASGRASCRGCGKKIPKGELRFGESVPNAFAEGDTTVWFHLVCAACMRPAELLEALPTEHPPLEAEAWLRRTAEVGTAHRRLPRLLAAERAASGRARCRACRELMDKGNWRLKLGIVEEGRMNPLGFIHAECSEAYFGTGEVLERIERLTPELSRDDVAEIARCLATPRPLAKTSPLDERARAAGDSDD